jgi:hypothetical protein
VDTQDRRYARPARRLDAHAAAPDRDVVRIDHDSRPGHEHEAPAADVSIHLQRGTADNGPGQVQLDAAAADPDLYPLRHDPATVALRAAAAALDPDELPGLGYRDGRALGRWHGRQVGGQHRELAVGPGRQGCPEPFVEFIRRQAAITSGHPEQLNDPVPVGVRGSELRLSRQIT